MIYQSSGAFKNIYTLNNLLGDYPFIEAIELSAGPYISHTDKSVLDRFSTDYKLAFHNYYPVPKIPIVLNLSSSNGEIVKNTISNMIKAIDLCEMYGSGFYSCHAGFLIDPKPSELGNINSNTKIIPYEVGLENFFKNLSVVGNYANSKGIKLLIENNVTSTKTLERFGFSPLLFSGLDGLDEFINLLPPDVGILCDFAHLKVSAKTLGFPAEEFFKRIKNEIYAVHLSDNDGLDDTNDPYSEYSWFWEILPKSLDYYSIEVYESNAEILRGQHKMLREYLYES